MVLASVLLAGLTGCGKDVKAAPAPTTKDYCRAVRAMAGPRPEPKALVRLVTAAANASPGAVAGPWHDLEAAAEAYADAVTRRRLDPAHPPVGLTPAETVRLNRRLVANAWATNVAPLGAELRTITKHVRTTCGVKVAL